MMFVLSMRGALYLERAVNLVIFLWSNAWWVCRYSSSTAQVDEANVSWRCLQISWKCSEAVGGLMFAFINLYNLTINRSLPLYFLVGLCVLSVKKFFTFPYLPFSPSIAFICIHNLYTYVVRFLLNFLFAWQDPAGLPISPIARLGVFWSLSSG